jgi:hypothetical protein
VWGGSGQRRRGGHREHAGALPQGLSGALQLLPSPESLVACLLVYQHVPIERYVELISDLTGGAGPSVGFTYGMLTRCASAVRPVLTFRVPPPRENMASFAEKVLPKLGR